jgi:DNA-binding HxlR family transcriptional regulator
VKKRRSYQQFCGLARALDLVGGRWTLLIVRELLLGPRRYSDLLEHLPSITTNLLAERLREMQAFGLVTRKQAPTPIRAQLYELTEAGRALEPAVMALAAWGGRSMTAPEPGEHLDIGWGLLSSKRRYRGGLSLVVELTVDGRTFELGFEPTHLAVNERAASRPDVVVTAPVAAVRAWLFGGADVLALRSEGALVMSGGDDACARLATAFRPGERAS